jgi:hypothetical protein
MQGRKKRAGKTLKVKGKRKKVKVKKRSLL